MAKCDKCGYEILEGEKFCSGCGAKVPGPDSGMRLWRETEDPQLAYTACNDYYSDLQVAIEERCSDECDRYYEDADEGKITEKKMDRLVEESENRCFEEVDKLETEWMAELEFLEEKFPGFVPEDEPEKEETQGPSYLERSAAADAKIREGFGTILTGLRRIGRVMEAVETIGAVADASNGNEKKIRNAAAQNGATSQSEIERAAKAAADSMRELIKNLDKD